MSMLTRLAATASLQKVYADDVFSTWLYNGTGATQTITNGVDLAAKGGMVWIKRRDVTENHFLFDTARGANAELNSNTTDASATLANSVTSFNANGFTLSSATGVNTNTGIYTSWTFRKQPKFFDVVTYTGNGAAQRSIAHNLGGPAGFVITKATSTTQDWLAIHRVGIDFRILKLNSNAAQITSGTTGDNWSSTFPVYQNGAYDSNTNGVTYVAYVFAHDTAADGFIKCGTYTGNGSATGPSVTLDWEPQWLMVKRATTSTGNWNIIDNIRGMVVGGNDSVLAANTTGTETPADWVTPTATGFQITSTSTEVNNNTDTYIYIAIRRPNKPPTSGTQVFQPTVYTGTGVNNRLVNTTIAPDMVWARQRNGSVAGMVVGDRMRGQPYLTTGATAAEVNTADAFDQQIVSTAEYGAAFSSMNGFWAGTAAAAQINSNTASNNHVAEAFKRAPGVFDVVCYAGNNSTQSISHNLTVAPELIIIKNRDGSAANWITGFDFTASNYDVMFLNANNAQSTNVVYASNVAFSAQPTSSTFSLGYANLTTPNASSTNYVAYLFASLAGISKVGSYTGNGGTANTNGTSQTIDCGFAAGARFVLIKRRDQAGDWYVFDSARGIVAASDPYLLTNSTAAEVTTVDAVDANNSGFIVNQTSGTNLNVTNATYIYLAIA